MKVVFIGGYEDSEILAAPLRVAEELYHSLRPKVKYLTRIACFKRSGKKNIRLKLFGRENLGGGVLRLGVFSQIKYILKEKPDFIHLINDESFYLFLFLLKPFCGFRIIYHCHSLNQYVYKYFSSPKGKEKIRFRIINFMNLRYSDKVIFLTQRDRRFASLYLRRGKERSVVIPNGIRSIQISGNPNDVIRKRIAFTGQIDRSEKGFAYLLNALSILNTGFELVVFGYKKQQSIKQKMPEKVNLRVFEPKSQAEYLQELSKSDLLVVPSMYDSFSLSLLEASMIKIPFIASSRAGITEHLPPDVKKLTYYYKSPEKLASLIKEYYREPGEFVSIIEKIYLNRNFFSWEIISEKYLSLYSNFAGTKNKS